ncbi:hypothetical protein, partial [Thermogutta sp.]|uniref:hypothetical protein n=1 Tax=Thermogutta sp. TaxID=1962930 RepID=UPI0025D2C5CD
MRGEGCHQSHVALYADQVGIDRDVGVVQLGGQMGNLIRGKKVSAAQAIAKLDEGASLCRCLAQGV